MVDQVLTNPIWGAITAPSSDNFVLILSRRLTNSIRKNLLDKTTADQLRVLFYFSSSAHKNNFLHKYSSGNTTISNCCNDNFGLVNQVDNFIFICVFQEINLKNLQFRLSQQVTAQRNSSHHTQFVGQIILVRHKD